MFPLSELLLRGFRLLPPRFREQLKARFSAAGHSGSVVDTWRARRLAKTWKRPEIIVPDVCSILDGLSERSLDGRRVMEFGSGFLLADAFTYAMFGATEVHAVDFKPLLQAKVFRDYVVEGGWDRFFPLLSERRGHKPAEEWFRKLSDALRDPGDDWFRRLGIQYIAPFDALVDEPPAEKYDFVTSRSTLEHLPAELAGPMVKRLAQLVAPGGAMYHYVHLADHRDIVGNPYGFLAADDDFSPSQHDVRGNGLRASDWSKIFSGLDFDWSEITYADDINLFPEKLAARIRAYDRDDLLVNHYLFFGHRRNTASTGSTKRPRSIN